MKWNGLEYLSKGLERSGINYNILWNELEWTGMDWNGLD